MKLRYVLFASAIVAHLVCAAAHAETVWLAGQVKDEDGKTICVYKAGFEKIYIPANIGDYCSLTADTN